MKQTNDGHLDEFFAAFPHPASELIKFIAAGDIFTIMLKNGEIIHHTPLDKHQFKKWLRNHGIIDIR